VIFAVLVVPSTAGATGASESWRNSSIDVVGGPVLANGIAIVDDVTSGHELEQTAIQPSDGSALWHQPFSASLITPGVSFYPVAIGKIVLSLTPGATAPSVRIQGLNAATGRVVWSEPGLNLVTDPPQVCNGGLLFCFPVVSSATGDTSLVFLDPANGTLVASLPGPSRAMGVSLPGQSNSGSLWQTDATVPTFEEMASTGLVQWTKSVSSIFGPNVDPGNGWDFIVNGDLDIGTVGVVPKSGSYDLAAIETLGISSADGSVTWRDPGELDCEGPLQFLSPVVLCKYSGEVSAASHKAPTQLTLEGINPATGSVTWAKSVDDAATLTTGNDLVFADATRIAVHVGSSIEVLNTASGRTTPPSSHEVFWCETVPTYKLSVPKSLSYYGTRASQAVYSSCSSSGERVAGTPSSFPGTVGVQVGGMFVWPTSGGVLQGTRI
jgi:PQQ-like domain